MKRLILGILALAMMVGAALALQPVGTVQAHGGGHDGGCRGFGVDLVAGMLAGPDFGQFLQDFAPGSPGAVAEMIDTAGPASCK